MHDNKPDQFVDELLEASLKRYGGEEPRAGLETRLRAGVRSRQGEARRGRLVWALAVCAGVLTAVVFVLHSAHAPNQHRVTSASVPQPAAKSPASPGSTDSRFGSPRLALGPKEKPRTPKPGVRATQRPEQFPTPMPLTEQEKLVVGILNNSAQPGLGGEPYKAEERAVTNLETAGIDIAPVEVKPLEDSESAGGK